MKQATIAIISTSQLLINSSASLLMTTRLPSDRPVLRSAWVLHACMIACCSAAVAMVSMISLRLMMMMTMSLLLPTTVTVDEGVLGRRQTDGRW